MLINIFIYYQLLPVRTKIVFSTVETKTNKLINRRESTREERLSCYSRDKNMKTKAPRTVRSGEGKEEPAHGMECPP